MKIFVTGDNHIGKKYAGHEKSKELSEERANALFRMVETANAEGCGLFAVTGDLFDKTNNISQNDIKKAIAAFSQFKETVVVLPGNHDYYDRDVKVWRDFIKLSADSNNIKLLNSYEPYSCDAGDEEIVIYPAFCDKPHSEPGENRLGWIKRIKSEDFPGDGKIRIGIAHGAVEGESLDKEGAYFVMKRDELNSIPMDIWLIGHTHVPFPGDLTTAFTQTRERIFNAGSHVQSDVANNTEGICFIVEIDKRKNIRAKKYVSGGIRFYRQKVAVTAGNMESEISNAVKGFGDNSVVELILSGAVSEDEYINRNNIIENALGRFLEHSCEDGGLTRLITKEFVEKEFPIESSFSRGFLNDLLSDPKEAQLAYELIMLVKNGKGDKK